MTAATTSATLTPSDVLFRAERRLAPLIARNGADDPLVLAVTSMYDALYTSALDGHAALVADVEPDSEDDMALLYALGLMEVGA